MTRNLIVLEISISTDPLIRLLHSQLFISFLTLPKMKSTAVITVLFATFATTVIASPKLFADGYLFVHASAKDTVHFGDMSPPPETFEKALEHCTNLCLAREDCKTVRLLSSSEGDLDGNPPLGHCKLCVLPGIVKMFAISRFKRLKAMKDGN
ncbi:hypothetical protein NEOLI_003742 [Neolecta irregularis DAH-3]|uniref:Uncharacterized protein n=1 Tax=Neolecta irregularis (strain DAH-3) TaxID=1198029 RepID=A0A1U7LMK7_NEOID|nr:hypothetical protein NEOLI_003742 [Neolecta irregularis DAH-3]|eukprot:OLL23751.1 hypothetical protein NEOLI_003742 [Neolecta irregularis DAH-3]